MRNRKLRNWLGHLLMAAMLFSQSALLWAQVAMPVQSHHPVQHDCQGQQRGHADATQQHCKQDCCLQDHVCTSHCLSACVMPGVILLPTAMVPVQTYLHNPSIHLAFTVHPDGMHNAVLERPPRAFA